MDQFIVGTEQDGDVVAIPVNRILYMRQDPAFTEVVIEGGKEFRLMEQLEQLGIAIYQPQQQQEETKEA